MTSSLDTKTLRGLLLAGISSLAFVAPAFAADAPAPVAAASADDATEVVVTARRREEKAQDVPISLTTLGGDLIAKNEQIKLAQDVVGFAPNTNAVATDGRERPRWFVRGVGTNNTDPNGVSPIGVYRDEVYIANFYAQAFPLFDQQRVEVLSGPQGTLWGKNTTGGAISFISKAPSFETGGYARAVTGSFGERGFDGAITGTLIPGKLAGRLSVYQNEDKGWNYNLYAGDVTPASSTAWKLSDRKRVGENDAKAVRAQLLWTPTEHLDILFNYHRRDYEGDQSPGYIQPDLTVAPINNPTYNQGYTSPANPLPYGYSWVADTGRQTIRNDGGFVRVRWNLGEYSLTSITAYEENKLTRWSNGSGSIPLRNNVSRQVTPDKQYSQELRLASPDTGAFSWIAGLYYFKELNGSDSWAGNLNVYTSPASTRNYSQTLTDTITESTAAFVSGTYEFSDKFKLTVGGRLNSETKTYSQSFTVATGTVTFNNEAEWWKTSSVNATLNTNSQASLEKTYDSFTFDITPQYAFSDNVLGYFRLATGYLSGGFNSRRNNGTTPATLQIREYEPEEITTYEFGLKTQVLDRKLTANVSAFYYDYPSIQVLVILPSTGTNTGTTSTAVGQGYANAAGWVKGVELTLDYRPNNNWHFKGAFGRLASEYTNYPIQSGVNYPRLGLVNATIDPSGGEFTRAPKFTGAVGVDYSRELWSGVELEAGVDYRYLAKQYYNPTLEFDPTLEQKGYGLVSANVALAFGAKGQYRLALTGQNLTDEQYYIHAIAPSNNGSSSKQGKPTSYLLSLSARF
ncbi:TonB-dependent receptor [Asticcacaulis sp. YBE204]|uniref:TonB-dependent receptor n=1 Tax=Asticcacaulis sp. YBE204 TaxID=1282363 RepID=UPI0003C3D4D6|nr:TonB-dependent receptor [Asticcacaulis sp. YBE204]ESQ80385.1 hypothetical protein AEYBE204_03730 [Asticcacaulis sp. YBE204]